MRKELLTKEWKDWETTRPITVGAILSPKLRGRAGSSYPNLEPRELGEGHLPGAEAGEGHSQPMMAP